MSYTSGNATTSAFPILDLLLQTQRIGLQALSIYQPFASAFLDAATPSGVSRVKRDRISEAHIGSAEQVVAIGEEVLNVGTRIVPGKTTRIRRVVVDSPVQQDVTLHTETVVIERRRPQSSIGQDVLTEVTVELSDSNEVPVVSKVVHLVEEVLLRKEVTARTETIRDTVKRDKLEIEEPSQLPVVFNSNRRQDERRREEKRIAETQDRKQSAVPTQTENADGEHKRQPH